MDKQNTSITLQEQVNLIWLSKVIKDFKTLVAKTGISLKNMEAILKNEKQILEEWKKKCTKNTVKYIPHTEDWDGIDALLLEWIARYKRNNITLTASEINNQVERLKQLLETPTYKLRNKMWFKINEIFNPQPDFNMSGETLLQDPIQILMTCGSRLLKSRTYHKFLGLYKRTYGKSEGNVSDNIENHKSLEKSQIEFVAIEDMPNENIDNDVEIVELSDDNNVNDPLLQEPVQQQKLKKNNSASSSSDFPSLTTIKLDYKQVNHTKQADLIKNHTKQAKTIKKLMDNIKNKTYISLDFNDDDDDELIEEFFEGNQNEFEEFISIDAEEKDPLNTKSIEFATLTNSNLEISEENENVENNFEVNDENNFEEYETFAEDNETEKQSQDSIPMTDDKTEKISIEIELDYNNLQQFIEQQESNEIEIIANNEEEEEEDIEEDESVALTNINDLQQLKTEEPFNTKVIEVENEENEKLELVYEIDESDQEGRSELLNILNKYTNEVSEANSIEAEKEIKIEPLTNEEDDPLKEVEDVNHHFEIMSNKRNDNYKEITYNGTNNSNDLKIYIENSEKQIKLERNPLLKTQKRSRNRDDANGRSTSISSEGNSLTSDIKKPRLEKCPYFNRCEDVIKYLGQIKDYLKAKNDEEGLKLLLKLEMSFANFNNLS